MLTSNNEDEIEQIKPKTILVARHLPTDKNGKGWWIKNINEWIYIKILLNQMNKNIILLSFINFNINYNNRFIIGRSNEQTSSYECRY